MKRGVPQKYECFDDLNVNWIYCGLKHSAVVSKNGDLYTFGFGNWGVLGHGQEENISHDKPKLVNYFKQWNIKVKDVVLGESHSMVLSEDGDVYTWGYGGKEGYFAWMFS